MLNENSLIYQIPSFLDAIKKRQILKITGISDDDIIAFIPHLLPHQLEYLAFISLEKTKKIADFYLFTWQLQYDTLTYFLKDELIAYGAIFLQGFPRVKSLSNVFSPGMRNDIDIYIPSENVARFSEACNNKGFYNYGYTDEDILIIDDDVISEFSKQYWADKEFTLTLPFKCSLPKHLPIDFGNSYPPWINRKNQWYLMVAIEIHNKYIDSIDSEIIENYKESWVDTKFYRSNLSSLIYFNFVRLYKGVSTGEKRLRLLLDTAYLFTNSDIINIIEIDKLISTSSLNFELRMVCHSLVQMHPIFSLLSPLLKNYSISLDSNKFNIQLFESLRIEI